MPSNPFAEQTRLLLQSESPEVLFSRLAQLDCPRRELVRVLVVTSQEQVRELFTTASEPGYSVSSVGEGNRISHFKLTHRYGRSGVHSQSGFLSVAELDIPHVYLLVAVSGWPFWNKTVSPLVQRLYPKVIRVYFSQEEMHRLAKGIRARDDAIRILKTSARRRLKSGTARRRFETDIRWTDQPLDVVFRGAAEENLWFKSITFELGRVENGRFESQGVEASISKYGSIFCNAFFGGLLKRVVFPMAEIAAAKFQFFTGRERRKTPDLPPRPVVISFSSDLFRSTDDSKKFIAAMGRMSSASCTVLHGNPYIHLSFVDNLDGSSARLWVLKPNELTIVPQIKTSEAALKRMVNHVFEEWGEGEIKEARG